MEFISTLPDNKYFPSIISLSLASTSMPLVFLVNSTTGNIVSYSGQFKQGVWFGEQIRSIPSA